MDIESDHNDGLRDILFNGDHMKSLYSEWCTSELLFSLIKSEITIKVLLRAQVLRLDLIQLFSGVLKVEPL